MIFILYVNLNVILRNLVDLLVPPELRRNGSGSRAGPFLPPFSSVFSHSFLDLIFIDFLDFGTYFGSIFNEFSMFLHYFFEHGFCIDF